MNSPIQTYLGATLRLIVPLLTILSIQAQAGEYDDLNHVNPQELCSHIVNEIETIRPDKPDPTSDNKLRAAKKKLKDKITYATAQLQTPAGERDKKDPRWFGSLRRDSTNPAKLQLDALKAALENYQPALNDLDQAENNLR